MPNGRKVARLKRVISVLLAVSALIYLTTTFFTKGAQAADEVSSVIAGFILILSVLGVLAAGAQPPPPMLLQDIVRELRNEVHTLWGREATNRGLMGERFIPIDLRVRGEDGEDRSFPMGGTVSGSDAWTHEQYMQVVSGMFIEGSLHRAIVYGPAGSGKSTLAVMMTLGLLRNGLDSSRLPLLLSLASWNPEAEDLLVWIDKHLNRTYRSTTLLQPAVDGSILEQLTYGDVAKTVLILDGLDELPAGTVRRAIKEISERLPVDMALVVLTRPRYTPEQLSDLRNAVHLDLVEPSVERTAAYLGFLALRHDSRDAWHDLRARLVGDEDGALAKLFRSPLFITLAWNAFVSGSLNPNGLMSAIDRSGVQAAKDLLLDDYLRTAVDSSGDIRDGERATAQLEYIAFEMTRQKAHNLAWWRIQEAVPGVFVAGMASLAVIPAYWLCLSMPLGLTRGFAIGTSAGIVLGVSRGLKFSGWAALVVALMSGCAVLGIGMADLNDVHVAVADAVQVASSMALVIWWKGHLTGKLRWSLTTVLGIGVISGLTTKCALLLFPIEEDDRGALSVAMAVSLGIGVAVMSARFLSSVAVAMQPSGIELRRRPLGKPWPHFFLGVVCAMAVGIAGSFVGGLRVGLPYGLGLAAVFGIVCGLPVGVVGGLIRWLNQPAAPRVTANAKTTFTNDSLVAVGAIVLLGAVSSLSILIVLGPAASLALTVLPYSELLIVPAHGVLFGLTLGVIVASYNTAWLTFMISLLWFASRRRIPWRFIRFLTIIHKAGVFRQEGPLYQFRNSQLQFRLCDRHLRKRDPQMNRSGFEGDLEHAGPLDTR